MPHIEETGVAHRRTVLQRLIDSGSSREREARPLFDNDRLKRNNFDLLRLVFAGAVCLVHTGELSGSAVLTSALGFLSAPIAVKCFFVVSGFLIFMSFERAPDIRVYASKRIRRIYPAYFVVVALSAIGLFAVSTESVGDYFSGQWVKYLLANLSFLNFVEPSLPGVFESNRMSAVNGALWTLKVEVGFYVLVPLFVFMFRRYGRLGVITFVYATSVLYAVAFSYAADLTGNALYAMLGRQVPGQLSYFMAGAFFFYYLDFFERNVWYFVSGSAAVIVASRFVSLQFLEPFALATAVIAAGLFVYLGNFGRFGDFSYGTYILHFPIIQVLLVYGWQVGSPWLFLASVVSLTLVAAAGLWHLVEKRFLSRQSHYIKATAKAQ